MENLANQINKITNSIWKKKDSEPLNLETVSENGINALQLSGDKITGQEIFNAELKLKMNFGKEYQKEKFDLLWEMIIEDGWTKSRLEYAIKQFIKTNKWKDWTIADIYNISEVKLFPYSWYLKKISEGVPDARLQGYRVNGVTLWKEKDGIELPFEKVS